jgi:hypothetical protein
VRRGEGYDGASFGESMNGRVDRNTIENFRKDPSLQRLQIGLRAFKQADAARTLAQYAVVIVLELGFRKLVGESFQIGIPLKFANT